MKTLKFKSLKDVPKLERIGVEIEFEPLEEGMHPSENMDDKGCINYVIEQSNSGNFAAWFCAHVIVRYKEIEEDDYLGGCSYASFAEFKRDPYYKDMIHICIERINKEIEDYNTSICRRWAIRKAKNLIAPYGLFIVSNREIPEVSI